MPTTLVELPKLMNTVVIRALHLNGIKHVAFDQGKKGRDIVEQFIKDESITVFLLHAEKER